MILTGLGSPLGRFFVDRGSRIETRVWLPVFTIRQEIYLRRRRFKRPIFVAGPVVILLLLMVLLTCVSHEAKAISKTPSPAEVAVVQGASNPANKISFQTVAKGVRSGIRGSYQTVARSRSEWEDLWRRHVSNQTNPPPLPAIDFAKDIVAAVFLGERPTGGYQIDIVSAEQSGGVLTVSFDEKGPRLGGIQTQAFTQPFHIIRIAITDAQKVVFRRLP